MFVDVKLCDVTVVFRKRGDGERRRRI